MLRECVEARPRRTGIGSYWLGSKWVDDIWGRLRQKLTKYLPLFFILILNILFFIFFKDFRPIIASSYIRERDELQPLKSKQEKNPRENIAQNTDSTFVVECINNGREKNQNRHYQTQWELLAPPFQEHHLSHGAIITKYAQTNASRSKMRRKGTIETRERAYSSPPGLFFLTCACERDRERETAGFWREP